MKRQFTIAAVLTALASFGVASSYAQRPAAPGPLVQVYKTPTCGCCANWVKHLQDHGFTTRVTDMNDLSELKAKHGVPGAAQSCHTATVDGYVLEGHVPATDVRRMLKERPAIAGIAVPGMPIGSPGMEVPGRKPDAYKVVSFDRQGQMAVYASH